MARSSKHQSSAAETLATLESRGDRLAAWMSANPTLILGVVVGLLVIAGGWGFLAASRTAAQEDASAQLAQLQADYRRAMGSSPTALEVTEPANAETAQRARTDYLEKFRELADRQSGTPARAFALLEVGTLQEGLGDPGAAILTYEAAAGELLEGDAMRAIFFSRVAGVHEQEGRWLEAAGALESASDVVGYPLRYDALAEAAWCYAEAGDRAQALAAFARVENEAPNLKLPEHIEGRLRELRHVAGAATPAG